MIRSLLALTALSAAVVFSAETGGIAGTWRGRSTCTTDASACHDESVVYSIKEIPDRTDAVLIRADKIVDGRPITMGSGEWRYDRSRGIAEWRSPRQTWLLKVAGTHIDGTLTMVDGTLFRKMSLDKDR